MLRWIGALACLLVLTAAGFAQEPAQRDPADRFKADVLLVVAHPDDETLVSPLLARLTADQRKRVSVIYTTRGADGDNYDGRERGPALGAVRESEAREACAKLGVQDVWFLEAGSLATQNVLDALANWRHGSALEQLVGYVRLTRPEVVISMLPSIFIGENHGEHQAAGVLATEAFDMAGDETVFPAQVTGPTKRFEGRFSNLAPWQPKKLYFFDDTDDHARFAALGPSFSTRDRSPLLGRTYARIALDSMAAHLSQFHDAIGRIRQLDEAGREAWAEDPRTGWGPTLSLVLGKAVVPTQAAADLFDGVDRPLLPAASPAVTQEHQAPYAVIGGPWAFLSAFSRRHGLTVPTADGPEIAARGGTPLIIPLRIALAGNGPQDVDIAVSAPQNWPPLRGAGRVRLSGGSGPVPHLVSITTPALAGRSEDPVREVTVSVTTGGKTIGEVHLRVMLTNYSLPL